MVEETFAPRAAAEREASPLVRELVDELEAVGVSYCHWKGNAFLDRALRAEDDLDLLVRRADGDLFAATLHRHGFKEARTAAASVPGVTHFYGYDRQADKLVHVHAYYRLIVGHDLTENYRVPIEDAFLDAAVRAELVRVPPRELEFILFVVRKTLEHCTWDAIALRTGQLSDKGRRELAFLQASSDRVVVDSLLEQHLPFIDRGLFAECLRALEPQAGIRARVRAGRRLVDRLEPYSRYSRMGDVGRKVWRRGVEAGRRLRSKPAPRKRLGAGAVIAVVGADGAGKSTAVEALFRWLSNDFAVTTIHLGKPPWSRTTFFVRGFLKARSMIRIPRRRDEGADTGSKAGMALALMTARDRYRAYGKAQRISLGGGLVICDRFPLPQLTLMDAPQIERMSGTEGRLATAMSRLEQRYYRALVPPDVLVVLRVDPEIAVQRQPGDEPDYIRSRWTEIWEVDWEALGFHVVDAGRPAESVALEIKSLVWSEL